MPRGNMGALRSYEGWRGPARGRRTVRGPELNGSLPPSSAMLNPGATCCARGHVGGHMTRPDFGGEEDQDRQPGILPQDREDSPEREIGERAPRGAGSGAGVPSIKTTRHMPPVRSALGAERSSPRARTRGDDQTAAGYPRSARWIWASRRGRVRGRQPTTDSGFRSKGPSGAASPGALSGARLPIRRITRRGWSFMPPGPVRHQVAGPARGPRAVRAPAPAGPLPWRPRRANRRRPRP